MDHTEEIEKWVKKLIKAREKQLDQFWSDFHIKGSAMIHSSELLTDLAASPHQVPVPAVLREWYAATLREIPEVKE